MVEIRSKPNILQAHCQSHTSPSAEPKLCQRACKANASEKEILKNAPPHDRKTKRETTSNRPTNHGKQGSTCGNRRLAQWRVRAEKTLS